jgi:hypothetical protein
MGSDDKPGADRTTVERRQVLAGTAASVVGGFAGCIGGSSGGDECNSGQVAVEDPDGTTHCVAPVESPQSVAEYYGYGSGQNDSASTPDGLATDDATVTFVYRNADTGDRSLVVINGDATATTDGGGRVAMTFEGVTGYEWQVQDGPSGSGAGDRDPYQTGDGEFGESESVVWGWDDSKTDGGAFGPLGDAFDVTAVHRAEGTVGDTTRARTGLERWLLVDGADLQSPVELATLTADTGDVSARFSADDSG